MPERPRGDGGRGLSGASTHRRVVRTAGCGRGVGLVVVNVRRHGDGGRVGADVEFVEGVEDGVDDCVGFLFRVDEQGHGQGGVDVPALGFEPAGAGAVAHALAGLGQVFLVVGEDGDQQAPGRIRVADGQGDAHAARDADV